jgi:hypothetical protein
LADAILEHVAMLAQGNYIKILQSEPAALIFAADQYGSTFLLSSVAS